MANLMHKIRAYLYENYLTDDPNDYIARVNSEKTIGIDEICQSAVARGGADISAKSMRHAVGLFLDEMDYQVFDGYAVNVGGYFTAVAAIQGVFKSPKEKFNREKHRIYIQYIQGEITRRGLAEVVVEIMGVAMSGSFIAQVIDIRSGSVNELLTPGRNLRIFGNKIKVAGDDYILGVYFVNTISKARTRVDEMDIVINNPSEVLVVIPDLPAGSYQLEIMTKFTTGKILKNTNTIVFDKPLVVE